MASVEVRSLEEPTQASVPPHFCLVRMIRDLLKPLYLIVIDSKIRRVLFLSKIRRVLKNSTRHILLSNTVV